MIINFFRRLSNYLGARSFHELAEKVIDLICFYTFLWNHKVKYIIKTNYCAFRYIPIFTNYHCILLFATTKIGTGTYYSFMIVRHPFDRVLSAYRDRILNTNTWQAQYHIPRMVMYGIAYMISSYVYTIL